MKSQEEAHQLNSNVELHKTLEFWIDSGITQEKSFAKILAIKYSEKEVVKFALGEKSSKQAFIANLCDQSS